MKDSVDFKKEYGFLNRVDWIVPKMFPEAEIDVYVREILEKSGNGAHTYDHTRRVLQLCLDIGKIMEANMRILGAAALLHDIGRPFEKQHRKSHSILSGELSREPLSACGYSSEEIEAVLEVIRTHRFTEGIEPTSLEGQILSDADKLDAIGAIGVFRGIAQAAVSGRGISGFLEHADKKLLKLKDLLYTDVAMNIAQERHLILEGYVEQLRKETDSNI